MENINDKLADAMEDLWAEGFYSERGAAHEILRLNDSAWAIGNAEDFCGHTIGAAGKGLLLRDIRRKTLISNERLAGKGPAGSVFEVAPIRVQPDSIQRGDIVTVNARKSRPYGSHIVLATGSVDGSGAFPTCEGNSNGMRADDSMGMGVVKKHRRVGDVARVYRLTDAHYIEGA